MHDCLCGKISGSGNVIDEGIHSMKNVQMEEYDGTKREIGSL